MESECTLAAAANTVDPTDRTLAEIGYDDYLTVEFVVPVDRTPLSQRTEIADAADAGASQGMEQFLRDHGTGTVPEHYYDRYVQDSIDRLRQALSAEAEELAAHVREGCLALADPDPLSVFDGVFAEQTDELRAQRASCASYLDGFA